MLENEEELGIRLEKKKILDMFQIEEENLNLVYETKSKKNIKIPIKDESEGVKKIFTLGMPIADAICNGKIIIFDELEVAFHPILSKKIIELFIKKVGDNRAQLLFTTHNTNLLNLNIFRRDQIYFTTRTIDTDFATVIKALSEIQSIRKTTDIEKGYLEGRYCSAPDYAKFNIKDIGEILC